VNGSDGFDYLSFNFPCYPVTLLCVKLDAFLNVDSAFVFSNRIVGVNIVNGLVYQTQILHDVLVVRHINVKVLSFSFTKSFEIIDQELRSLLILNFSFLAAKALLLNHCSPIDLRKP
jgi:hypothetical protein